jgi:hypothetical protein
LSFFVREKIDLTDSAVGKNGMRNGKGVQRRYEAIGINELLRFSPIVLFLRFEFPSVLNGTWRRMRSVGCSSWEGTTHDNRN